ncbi:TetR/AcrR family transcriptional regulator [Nocardia sp. NPDC051030]|uniref:TetR/AcrR family transcriptional regulator n=1 Tax=Nocardia sp. NPDC051030 TaxID=3155162 RepID=UPI0034180457
MGNREDLLAGARQCLVDKGYARTTVRDIATASGVSMAAIGYHFGSKEALLTAALSDATREWGDELAQLLTNPPARTDPFQHFAATWDTVRASIGTHRGLWSATFDALSHPETRARLAAEMPESRTGLAHLLAPTEPPTPAAARATGALYQALLVGIAAQYLIDPETAPTGTELAEALRRMVGLPQPAE